MTRDTPAVVVIGATGYTGRLIARELADAGTPYVLAARDPDRLRRFAGELDGAVPQVVDVTDPDSLRRLLRRGDAVINTVGPFVRLGEPVVAACITAGAHYLDTTGEQRFMRAIRERYHAAAREAGVAVVNAMAFEFALGDCAAAVVADRLPRPLRTVDVTYAWGGTASSRGTRRTSLGILGARGWTRRAGELRRTTPGARRRVVRLASGAELGCVTFPAGEVLTVPRHVEVDDVRSWLVVGRGLSRVAPIVAPALPFLVPPLRPLLERLALRPADPTPEERRESRFTIRVEATDAEGGRRAVELQGRDPYGITAAIAVAGARRAMEPDAPTGVVTPAQLMEPGPFLASHAVHGLALVEDEG